MFDKFGEFDSAQEINEAAAAQLAEGDTELTGKLPSPGNAFRAKKGEANQYEITGNDAWDIENIFRRCREEMTVTKCLFQSGADAFRVIQNRRTNNCFFVSERFIAILDSSALTEGESLPEGPRALADGRGGPFTGKTTACRWQSCPFSMKTMTNWEATCACLRIWNCRNRNFSKGVCGNGYHIENTMK